MPTISMCMATVKGEPVDRETLSRILSEHKAWLEAPANGRRADLREMNFEKADLSGVDLSSADLAGAWLKNAKLVGTKLAGAVLDGAFMHDADLTDADLRGARLSHAKACHACFKRADMEQAILTGSVLWESDFEEASLKGAILTAAELCDCDFTAADLSYADLYCANLDYTVFRDADLKYARIGYAENSFYADFKSADLTGVDFSECPLNEGSMEGATGFHPHMRCPEEGSFVAWKKCRDNRIVKLRIPETAARTGACVDTCRASEAAVLDIRDAENGSCEEAVSCCDRDLIYRKGETVYPEEPFDDRLLTDGSGIHFFLTRTEAELFEPGEDEDDSEENTSDSVDKEEGSR
ncbi:MAG: pentapeptide repeat-containing protein [Clostridia bacterium]|nr:pentapeptide repeat-containing protein [Clostridia bacterium]